GRGADLRDQLQRGPADLVVGERRDPLRLAVDLGAARGDRRLVVAAPLVHPRRHGRSFPDGSGSLSGCWSAAAQGRNRPRGRTTPRSKWLTTPGGASQTP